MKKLLKKITEIVIGKPSKAPKKETKVQKVSKPEKAPVKSKAPIAKPSKSKAAAPSVSKTEIAKKRFPNPILPILKKS